MGFKRTGIANLPLHSGKVPRWLFERMTLLAREVCLVLVEEFGSEELLRRMSDPYWFQAFGCVLGYDWHSSGLTTTLCAALKEGLKGLEHELGLFVAGGKGRISRRTPEEIRKWSELEGVGPEALIYASRMVAKVDTSALQDNHQLYHHTFLFIPGGSWAVVQQGMNEETRYARRYHWLGERVRDFVCEPHAAICSDRRGEVLNLVARESAPAREAVTQIAAEEKPEKAACELKKLQVLDLPHRHFLSLTDIHPERLSKILLSTYERSPQNFEELLGLPKVGPKTIRALSLLAELIYGVPSSFRDPARYSFAHGGKDGRPYPIDLESYDRSVQLLRKAVLRSRIGEREKREAISQLDSFFSIQVE